MDTATGVVQPREALRLDQAHLQAYLQDRLSNIFSTSILSITQFGHGQSNPTYLLEIGSHVSNNCQSIQRLVLRKKPPGHILASAHAVEREYAVLSALAKAGHVPVPRPLLLCEDPSVIGTPFYVMQFASGKIFLDPNLPNIHPSVRREMYHQMAQCLAALHSVDPAAAHLQNFGTPSNYCSRQLRRWAKQYQASVPAAMPEVVKLISWLEAHVPAEDAQPPRPAICHGDYRLDNLVFDMGQQQQQQQGQQQQGAGSSTAAGSSGSFISLPHQTSSSSSSPSPSTAHHCKPTLVAILDWELSTLGNPWADVAYNCMPYHLPPNLHVLRRLGVATSSSAIGGWRLPEGIPNEQEYVAMYCRAAGVSPPCPADWAFYLALSLFRLLAILAGVQARARQGNASSSRAALVSSDEVLKSLADAALGIIADAESSSAALAPSAAAHAAPVSVSVVVPLQAAAAMPAAAAPAAAAVAAAPAAAAEAPLLVPNSTAAGGGARHSGSRRAGTVRIGRSIIPLIIGDGSSSGTGSSGANISSSIGGTGGGGASADSNVGADSGASGSTGGGGGAKRASRRHASGSRHINVGGGGIGAGGGTGAAGAGSGSGSGSHHLLLHTGRRHVSGSRTPDGVYVSGGELGAAGGSSGSGGSSSGAGSSGSGAGAAAPRLSRNPTAAGGGAWHSGSGRGNSGSGNDHAPGSSDDGGSGGHADAPLLAPSGTAAGGGARHSGSRHISSGSSTTAAAASASAGSASGGLMGHQGSTDSAGSGSGGPGGGAPKRAGRRHASGSRGSGGGAGESGLPDLPPHVASLLDRLEAFMADHVYPAEPVLEAHAEGPDRWAIHPLMEELKEKAKAAGLWNLWLPATLAAGLKHLIQEPADQQQQQQQQHPGAGSSGSGAAGSSSSSSGLQAPLSAVDRRALLGAGLSNWEYAHLCEVMGRSLWAPEVFNCSAPDTGNMEVLAKYGTPEQQRRWLLPLLLGRCRSCFAMTEKEVASSDATNIQASIVADGSGCYSLSGVKWWTSGAMDPRCAVAIFMGKTDPRGPPHLQQSMVLVPTPAPGVRIVRPLTVFGYDDAPHGHAEVHFEGVQVPKENIILGEGRGFEIAQGRLGPGRLHHCMRLVGLAERSIELMAARALQRTVFGRPLAGQGAFQSELAQCRIALDGARLLVLAAADALDKQGNKGARGAIAVAKVAAPNAALRVVDAAIQAHGGAGVSQDTVLARLWAAARVLRIADGPDEVHLGTIAKLELSRARSRL